jgi:hypothetical protein
MSGPQAKQRLVQRLMDRPQLRGQLAQVHAGVDLTATAGASSRLRGLVHVALSDRLPLGLEPLEGVCRDAVVWLEFQHAPVERLGGLGISALAQALGQARVGHRPGGIVFDEAAIDLLRLGSPIMLGCQLVCPSLQCLDVITCH